MKSQAKKAITLSGGAAFLVFAVGFGGGDPLPTGTTTTPSPLQDVSLCEHLGESSGCGQTLKTGGPLDRALVVASAVSGADLLRQAPEENPLCVAGPTNPCLPPLEDSADSPSRPQPQATSRPRKKIICQSLAPKWGAFCYTRRVS